MGRAIRRFRDESLGFWAGLPVPVFAFMADLLTLIINLSNLYAHPDITPTGIDPVTEFVMGLGAIWIVSYLLRALRSRSVWAAVGLAVAAPVLYMTALEGVVAAVVDDGNYFEARSALAWWVEILPACALVAGFGAQALRNYGQRFRRLR